MVDLKPLLQLSNVSLQFGGLKAVSNFEISLFPQQIMALIGPNGAGKTTVFNIITGVYVPDTGTIQFKDQSLSGKRSSAIAAMGVTRTFQNIRLFKDLTVLDNVKIAFHLRHSYGLKETLFRTAKFWNAEQETEKSAIELLKLFSLEGRADEKASNLPYGEQRKLEIVRALATEPSVLLLDEPAAGLNDNETTLLMQMIRRIRDQYHLAILLIEHDMKMVMEISDQITVLDQGVIIASGLPKEIRNNPKVIEAYLGVDHV